MSVIITYVDLGRKLTSEESAIKDSALSNAIAAGTTNGTCAHAGASNPGIRIWTTEAAANEWLGVFNSFTPPPVSAMVQTV